jgi:prophage antirepressor-like protein
MTTLAPLERVFGDHRVRIVLRDGEPWFVAADVCRVLGYANGRAALAQHCKGVAKHDTLTEGGVQAVSVIPERDVYRLVMRSNLPGAERFEEWVVDEVLPSIRKTGSYGQSDHIALLNDPAALRGLLNDYAGRVLELQAANAELAPKAEVYDRIVDNTGTLGFREAAKVIHSATGVSEPEFRLFLLSRGWIQRLGGRLAPAHYGQAQGYVTTREREVATQDGVALVVPELRITQRGIARATKALLKESA